MGSFSQSIYQMGYVLSGILIGYLSDSYGRFRALFVALLFELLGGILLITSNSIYVYTLSRFVLGFGDSGRGMCLYMLILETVIGLNVFCQQLILLLGRHKIPHWRSSAHQFWMGSWLPSAASGRLPCTELSLPSTGAFCDNGRHVHFLAAAHSWVA